MSHIMSLLTINVYSDNEQVLKEIKHLKTIIMATLKELTQKVDDLQTALDAEQLQIADAIAQLQTTINDLRANETANGTPEERQALADKLDAIKTDLEGTIPDTTTETPTP